MSIAYSPPPSTIQISHLDHLVLTVASIDRTIAWYKTHLGLTATLFKSPTGEDLQPRCALIINPPGPSHISTGITQKINLHEAGHEFEPKARNVMPGSADLCFVTQTLIEVAERQMREGGVEVLDVGGTLGEDPSIKEGKSETKITERTGANGKLKSFYVRDPDGNLIEWVFPRGLEWNLRIK